MIYPPVSRDSVPNSTMYVPTPAVHVIGVSPSGTPVLRLTVPYGIPVGVSNAGSNRSAEIFKQHINNRH